MTADEVRRIVAKLEAAGIEGFSLTTPETTLRITLGGAAAATTATPAPSSAEAPPCLRARGTGAFLPAHPGANAPIVQPGQRVRAGEVVALLRTGALLQPVTATQAGTIGRCLAEPGGMVGHGTPLMEFRPDAPQEKRSPP